MIPLEKHVYELRELAKTLMPYSFPKVNVVEDQEITPLRTRQIVIDGYDVGLSFCISNYEKYQLESLQIQGLYTPFLPFALVCKIARCFLGSEHLSYTDLIRDNRKIYCWTIRRRKGRAIPMTKRARSNSYEGLTYNVLELGKTN